MGVQTTGQKSQRVASSIFFRKVLSLPHYPQCPSPSISPNPGPRRGKKGSTESVQTSLETYQTPPASNQDPSCLVLPQLAPPALYPAQHSPDAASVAEPLGKSGDVFLQDGLFSLCIDDSFLMTICLLEKYLMSIGGLPIPRSSLVLRGCVLHSSSLRRTP